MSEIIKATVEFMENGLGQWPVVQGFFIIVISFCGVAAMRRGDRERKFNQTPSEAPLYLMAGPLYDLTAKVNELINIVKTHNQMLEELREREARRHRDY